MREIPTASGEVIRLFDRELHAVTAQKVRADLEALAPGVRDQMIQERRAQLTGPQREAVDTPPEDRTVTQHELAFQAESKLQVTYEEVAQRLTGAQRSRALELAKKLAEAERLELLVARYREIVNFEGWQRRAQIEQKPQAWQARKFIYDGNQAFVSGDLPGTLRNYHDGFAKWRELLDAEPGLVKDPTFGRDWMEIIQRYRRILDACDQPFPEKFILQDVVDLHRDLVSEEE